MKKTMLAATHILVMSACKKQYTCECRTTFRINDGTSTYTFYFENDPKPYDKKLKLKQAEAACAHEGQTVESAILNNITGNGAVPMPSGWALFTTCDLD